MKHFLLIAFLLTGQALMAQQTVESLISDGKKLEAQFKEKEALQKYQAALLKDADNIEALCKVSYILSKEGERMKEKTTKQNYFNKAAEYSLKAIKLNDKFPDAHYTYAVALGRISLMASNEEKLKNAKLIKQEAERTLQLDSKHAGAYHIMGKLNSEIANMNIIKVMAAKALYGGVPEGCTYEKATDFYNKAIENRPNYILYYYDAAVNFNYMGRKDKAKELLNKAIALPMQTPDDPYRIQDCKSLLAKLK